MRNSAAISSKMVSVLLNENDSIRCKCVFMATKIMQIKKTYYLCKSKFE